MRPSFLRPSVFAPVACVGLLIVAGSIAQFTLSPSSREARPNAPEVHADRPVTDDATSRAPEMVRSRRVVNRHRAAQRVIADIQQLSGAAPLDATLGRTFIDGARVTAAGTTVAAVPIGARAARRIDAGGATTYLDAWPGVDVVQEPGASWLKESLVVHRPSPKARSFVFELRGRPTPRLTAAGDIAFRDGATPIALRIPAPRAVDAAGTLLPRSATTFQLTGRRLTLRAAVPAGTAYPVTIDPTFAIGQGADHVIGVDSFDNAPSRRGRTAYGFTLPRALASDGANLLVGDSFDSDGNRRISVFNSVPTANAQPEDSFWASASGVAGLWTNGTRSIIADSPSHRVLVHDAFTGVTTRTLGQSTPAGFQANPGGRTASTMNNPQKVWSDGNRIAVADTNNDRVLIWTSWPSATGQPADIILGQPDGSASGCNRGATRAADTLCAPWGVYFDGASFYVADTGNNRVLVWDDFPDTTGQSADRLLGQSAFNRGVCNDAALPIRARMCEPGTITGDGTRLLVVERSNHRAVLWNTNPTLNAQPFDIVFGTTGSAGTTQHQLWNPYDSVIIGGKVAIADYNNNRVLVWNSIPAADSQPADVVMGHQDFTHNGYMDNQGDAWDRVMGLDYDGQGRLWTTHYLEGFAMRFPATLPPTGAVAEYSTGGPVPGQVRTTGTSDRAQVREATDINVTDDGRLVITNNRDSRVTWNNVAPSTNPVPVFDGVLGQTNLFTLGANRSGSPAADTLSWPQSADWDGSHFAVADSRNNRILVWHGMPSSGAAADVVVGQPDFTTVTPNTGGVSANSLSGPSGVRVADGKLYVADAGNNRVLVWNSIPTTDHEAADIVLGQSTMFASGAGVGPGALDNPTEVDVDEGMIAVADMDNNRVLLWDSIPTASSTPADRVIGQSSLSLKVCSRLRAGLCNPQYIALRDGKLAVNDGNARIAVYDDVSGPTVSGVAAVVAGERATVSWNTDEDASSELVWDTTPHALPSQYAYSASPAGRRRAHSIAAQPLASGTTYYYRVVSVDASGNVTTSSEGTFAASNTTRLQASSGFAADATVNEAQPTHNYGGANEIVIGGGPAARDRALVRFDLDQLPPGATVLSATLRLHQTDAGSGSTPTIDALLAERAWDEGSGDGTFEPTGTTWSSADGVDPWTTAGGDGGAIVASAAAPATAPETMDVDLTTQIGRWANGTDANHGLLLQVAPEATGETRRFASSEHTDPALRPVLTIEWSGRDVTPPRVANVRTEPITSSSVRVRWDTDETTTTVLEYGPTTAYGSQTDDPVARNEHALVLVDLQPSTTYHVRVSATDAQGNLTRSADTVFRTSYRARIVASDTTLREDRDARNNGGQSTFFVGNANASWQRARSALQFDVTGIPAAASIRSATASMVLAGQASTATPQLQVQPLAEPFVEGSGNPSLAPGVVATAGSAPSQPEPLHSSSERHMLLTPTGWWQLSPQATASSISTYMRHRRSYDGITFSTDATFGRTTWGKNGIALAADGATAWSAGFTDNTTILEVASYDASSGSSTGLGFFTMPGGVQYLPSVALADDGTLWVKGETADGQIWVTRSTAPRAPGSWAAATQVASQTSPGHATLVPLSGGRMLLISQDGGQLSSREWDGAAWGVPLPVAANAAVPSAWLTRTSFAAVDDGSGGAWVTYAVAGGGVHASHYASGTWSAPATLSASGTAVAISRDANGDVPVVFWQQGTSLQISRNVMGSWSSPDTLPVTLPATTAQLAATQPSDEALGITWTVPVGSTFNIQWHGITLDKLADGATWDTTDGATAWAAPGADSGAPALATPTAPGEVGGEMSFDLTAATTGWHAAPASNLGVLVRAATENPAVNDWKAFYSSESLNPSLRPTLTVDYDLATVTMTQPTSATAWRPSSANELRWSVVGSGMTQAEIRYSDDGGATWSHLIDAAAPNTGSYQWTTPPAAGTYRVQVQAKNALGDVVAIGETDPFVLDDVPPDPVTDLAAPSPSNHSLLSWTQPSDTGGAGMANGNYRIYRSTSIGVLGTRIATVPTLLYDDVSSIPDGTYYYTALPVDAAGNVQPVGNAQITVVHDAQQPNAVSDLVGPVLTNTAVSLTWSAVSDVGLAGMGTYRLHRSSSAGALGAQIATGSPPGLTDTPPSDGTWYYTIVPMDVAGNARVAGNNQVAVTYDTTPPSSTSVQLDGGAAWTATGLTTASMAATGATQYQLSEDPAFGAASWTAVAATAPMALVGDGTHVVYARFRDAAGNVSANTSDSIAVDTTPPSAVTTLAIPSPATSAALSWSAASDTGSGIDHYTVYRSSTAGVLGTSVATTSSLTRSDTPPSEGTWYYTVRAVDALGHERPSGDSQIAFVHDTTPPTPGPMTATAVANSPTQITWTADVASDAVGLAAQPYSFDVGVPIWQASRTVVSVGLTPNTSYTRTVRASDAAGNVSTGSITRYTLSGPPSGLNGSGVLWNATDGYAVNLAWSSPVNGAASYRIRSSADAYATVVASPTTTSATITHLGVNAAYTFKVCAVNGEGVEEATCSSPVTVSTDPVEYVSAPTVQINDGWPHISWTSSSSGTTEVHMDTSSHATPSGYSVHQVVSGSLGLAHSMTVKGLAAGTYHYRVQTCDGATCGYSSDATFTITDGIANGRASDAAMVTNGPVYAMAVDAAGNTFIGGSFSNVGPRTGGGTRVDPAGTGTLSTTYEAEVNGTVHASVSDGAGGYFIGGDFGSVGGLTRRNIAHIRPDGSVDPAWYPTGGANNAVRALVRSGTNLYAGGDFTSIGGQARNRIAKLDAAGTGVVDAAWYPAGGSASPVRALAVSGSGLFVGGDFTNIGGQSRSYIARLDAAGTGAVDPAWTAGGGANFSVLALATSGTSVYVGGNFFNIGGVARGRVAKLDAGGTGAVDPVWDAAGGASSAVHALAISGTNLYVGGAFANFAGTGRIRLVKVDAGGTGALDAPWNPAGANGTVSALSTTAGSLYAGGDFTSIGGHAKGRIAKLESGNVGAVDAAWHMGVGANGSVTALAAGPGSVYVGGSFTGLGGAVRSNIAKLDPTGALDVTWNPPGGANGIVRSMALNGVDLFVGGEFTNIGGQARARIARLAATGAGAVDGTWNPGGTGANNSVLSLASSGGNVFAGGMFTSIGGQSRNYIAKLDAAGSGAVDTSWYPTGGANLYVNTLALSGSDLFAGGSFFTIGGQSRGRVAKLDAGGTGAVNASWNPGGQGANSTVNTLLVKGASVYVGGVFGVFGGVGRSYLVKVDAAGNGNLDAAWNPGSAPSYPVHSLALTGSSLYAGGQLAAGASMVKMNPIGTGAIDAAWNPTNNTTTTRIVHALGVSGSSIYAGGDFLSMGVRATGGVAALSSPPNNAPLTPALVSPAAAAATTDATPDLTATYADLDSADTGTLTFEVCSVATVAAQSCAGAGGTVLASGSSTGGIANGANGTWTVTPVLPDGVVYWHAYATDDSSIAGGWSATRALTVDTTAPTPAPMSATAVADSTTQITWTADVATDAIELHATPYSVDSGTPTWQTSRGFVESGLSANTQYSRTVRARDAVGNVRTGTIQARTLPDVPTGASATRQSWTGSDGYSILLDWTAPTGGAASYHIRSSADAYATVVATAAGTSHTIGSLLPNTAYNYRVCAVNADGAQSATCTTAVSATTAPAPPAAATTSNITASNVDIDWADSAGATAYYVFLFTDGACTTPLGLPTLVGPSAMSSATYQPDRTYSYLIMSLGWDFASSEPSTCFELDSATERTALLVSTPAASQDFGDRLPGETIDGDIDLDVESYASAGYSVAASIDALPTNGSVSIPATTSGTVAAPGSWTGTGFGLTVASATNLDPKWANGTAFAAPPLVPTTIHTTGTTLTPNTPQTTRTTVGYRILVPPTQAEGTYTTTITLTAVPLA